MSNKVFVGTSLDGYIADRNGELGFLETVPNPDKDDLGFVPFMNSIDALLMGRKTLDMILGFDMPWPYFKKVFVISSTRKNVPEHLDDKVERVEPTWIQRFIH